MSSSIFSYVVVIKNESIRYVNITGVLISVASALLFAKEMAEAGRIQLTLVIGIVFIAGVLVYNWYRSKRDDVEIYYAKALLIAGLVWTEMPYFNWLFFVFVALALLEYQAKLPLEIGFSPSFIVFNSLLKKKYQWSDLSNVILRDGLLTIDFRNNKLFQREIDEGESEASEAEFNEWCNKYLIQKSS